MKRLLGVLLLFSTAAFSQTILFRNATVFDGSGKPGIRTDVRVSGGRIAEIGRRLRERTGDQFFDAFGLALAPGLIDMHSHADGEKSVLTDPDAANIVRQGITTVVVGQDGESQYPLADFFSKLEKQTSTLNVASMVGHATVRAQVMGKDLYRAARPEEIARMRELMEKEMAAGAFGLSSGLEYEAAHFATTDEVVQLARVAGAHGGFYISHVRDEGTGVWNSFRELIAVGRQAKLPAEITHIKLGTTPVWHQAPRRMPAIFNEARSQGVELRADVYPYTFWQSTLRVLVLDRDWFNPEKVAKALEENGGPARIRLTRYEPDVSLAGKTLEEAARQWQVTPVEAYMRMIRETSPRHGETKGRDEGIIGESMSEDDVRWFIRHPRIAFCTDGGIHDRHPRAAGAFPRILGHYVREQKVLTLTEAIRKMTSLPASYLGLRDRGKIARGYVADLVLFDPRKIADRATIENPEAAPEGVVGVMVGGVWVVREGKVTDERPGKVLRHEQARPAIRRAVPKVKK